MRDLQRGGREQRSYMKTKKALAGLFGLFGSFAGLPFGAAFFPAAAPFFTDNLTDSKVIHFLENSTNKICRINRAHRSGKKKK